MAIATPQPDTTSNPTAGWRQGTDLWVFAYGSLMWNPDFDHDEARTARLAGYHRAMCILSYQWRGTPERPGLVMGLDRGGSCRGRVFRVAAPQVPAAMEHIYRREMPTGVYVPRFVPVTLDDGRRVEAWAFIARRGHPQYVAHSSPERSAALIRQGHGKAGACRDYLANTIVQLEMLGLGGAGLKRLLALVDDLTPS
nr:gamma-glutamylcyclotransferase [Magnetospirillum sp. 15-1]